MVNKHKVKAKKKSEVKQLAKETVSSLAKGTLEGLRMFGDTTAEGFRYLNEGKKKQ